MSSPPTPPSASVSNSSTNPTPAASNAFNLFPLRLLAEKKQRGELIAMISLYDAPSAKLACDGGADVLLVGDSLGNVVLGYPTTIPVSMEDMLRHTGAVVRGARQSQRPDVPIVADLPFGSYAGSRDAIARNAAALLQIGAHAVKLEGSNQSTLRAVEIIYEMGGPVVGHIGFTPQSVLNFSRVVQGRSIETAQALLDGALALEAAGCCALVVEAVPVEVAATITRKVSIPVIGIGAGAQCDGQVLVWHDLVGLSPQAPRFAKAFGDAHKVLSDAVQSYVREVQGGTFPEAQRAWNLSDEERAAWLHSQSGSVAVDSA